RPPAPRPGAPRACPGNRVRRHLRRPVRACLMAGVFAGIGAFFGAGPLVGAAEATRWLLPTDVLWRGTVYGLEPSLIGAIAGQRVGPAANANPFYASAPPPTAFVVWSAVWIALVLGLAIWSFSRRDR